MKKILLSICFFCFGVLVFAGTVNVTGTVKDSKGEPVIGAVVMVQDSRDGVVTGVDGRYSISVDRDSKQVLVISCMGYKNKTVGLGSAQSIDIVLEEDNELLDEVVVVGYGAMRRSDLTGSVASVKISDEEAAKSATLDQMLEGKAAGVQVLSDSGSPDSGISIRVRGISSFSGSTEPLYVVDGIIISGTSESIRMTNIGAEGGSMDETTNGLAGINPQDIASIEILKDASATAIYGSQGANGVVLITTKSANKDRPSVSFTAGVSVSQTLKKADILSFDEYVEMLANNGGNLSKIYEDPVARTGLLVEPIDWQDYLFRTAVSQRYYVSVAGRPKGYNYLFSLGYNHNEGILQRSQSDNITARLNLKKDITRNLSLDFKTNVGYTSSDLVSGAQTNAANVMRASVLRSALRSRPYYSPNASEDDYDEAYDPEDETNYGPMRYLKGVTNTSERLRITPSLSLNWKLTGWLTFKSSFGADFTTNKRIKTKVAALSYGDGNIAGIGTGQILRYNWDNMLMVNKTWSKHNLSGTLGMTASKLKNNIQSISASKLPQANAREMNINEALPAQSHIENFAINESSLLSFFGRAIYNYDERYILTSTLRFDGSSKFQGSNKWGIFPSFAFAWRIVNEPWFNVPAISNAKLRLGWGQVGNQNIGSFQTTLTYATSTIGNHFNDSHLERIMYPSNIQNPNLKWETSDQVNAGLDLSFWKGRLAFTVDGYLKQTRDLLQDKLVARSAGVTSMAINEGTIINKGIEFSIDATPVKTGDFELGVGGNISFNKNYFVTIGPSSTSGEIFMSPDATEASAATYVWGTALATGSSDTNPLNVFIEGQTMGLFYGYVTDGIVQEGSLGLSPDGWTRSPGYMNYKDLNGNGVLDAGDRAIIGNPQPKFTYGFYASASWKRFTLKADFTGAYDFDIFNMNNMQDYDNETTKNMIRSACYNAWTPENKNNEWPAMGKSDDSRFSDRFVEDATYLRISNISLTYDVPIKKTSKIVRGMSISASVSNLAIFSSYSGFSPISNSMGSNIKKIGVDINTAPLPRSFNFDLKFRF